MSRKIKIGGLIALALIFTAVGAFGLSTREKASADVVSGIPGSRNGSVYIIPQHFIPAAVGTGLNATNASADWNCADANGIAIGRPDLWQTEVEIQQGLAFPGGTGNVTSPSIFNPVNGQITNLFGTGIVVKPPQQLAVTDAFGNLVASRSTLEIPPGGFIYICVNPSKTLLTGAPGFNPASAGVNGQGCGSAPDNVLNTTITLPPGPCTGDGDGDMTFDSRNIGGFSEASCDNPTNDVIVGNWPSDACFGVAFDFNDANLDINDLNNDLTTVIVTYTCTRNPAYGGIVFPLTVEQDMGSQVFNVICEGTASASSVSISMSPSTVEIVPARSNTSNSLISVNVLDALGNPVPNIEVEIQTNRCAVSAGAAFATTQLTSLPIGVGFDDTTRSTAAVLVSGLNTANPLSFAQWEAFALAHFPTGSFANGVAVSGTRTVAITQNANFSLATGLPTAGIAAAILGCSPTEAAGATPGPGTITAIIPVVGAPDIIVTTNFTVIGPPASITVAAAPTSLNCGEKSTVTATVKDTAGQNVSDHTRVEMVTNLGGVLAGTGAVAASAGPVVPISSTVADTFGGVATAFLLTSDSQNGPYEVVATSGGTTSEDFSGTLDLNPATATSLVSGITLNALTGVPNVITGSGLPTIDFSQAANTILGGIFSTPPVSAQTTVSCGIPVALPAIAAPSISAPRTGQGLSISPPNTGDAGLAGTSGANWTLFAIGGVALSLVGLASLKFARR